jgi:hypothetical protein
VRPSHGWLLAWIVPTVLLAGAIYEVGLMLWGDYAGLESGQNPGADRTITAVASMAMLVGVFVAAVHAVRPRVPWAIALFAPAATAFVIARFYTYDPYYFPTLRRYSEGRGAGGFLAVMVVLSIAVGVWSRLRPRSGSAGTALVLPFLLFSALLLWDGH